MRRWVQTSWYRYHFKLRHSSEESKNRKLSGGRWETNFWDPDPESVQAGLKELQHYCDENQYEIKSVTPLTRGHSHEYGIGDFHHYPMIPSSGGWGVGYGWGVSVTIGFMAVLQRIEEISDEEYQRRMDLRKKAASDALANEQRKKRIREVEDQFQVTKAFFEELKSSYQKLEFASTCSVTTEKGIFGTKYVVSDKSFKSPEHAEKYIKECGAKAAELLSEIDKTRNKMNKEWEELSSLKDGVEKDQFTLGPKDRICLQ